MNELYIFIFFILGLILGSFYNVVGFRLPNNKEILGKEKSHCPKCKHILKWYELIPIISYIIQKGKCRECRSKISLFYPFIELSTGLLFAVSYYSFGFSYDLVIILALVSVFMIILVSDLNFLIIPDSVLIVSSIIIVITNFLKLGIKGGFFSILSGLLLFTIMYLIMLLGNFLFKKESLGGGDVKLMFLAGLTLHPLIAIFSIFFAF